MTYESISDFSNPFNKTGLSREVRGLLSIVETGDAAGLDLVVTSTTDHPKYTNSGNLSRHVTEGTDGKGLAIDGRIRQRGTSPGLHRPFFDLWLPYEKQLHELIYAYPPSGLRADGSFGPYNIKAGKRVAPYAVTDHKDHVHNSVNKGVILSPAPQPEPEPPEPVKEWDEMATEAQVEAAAKRAAKAAFLEVVPGSLLGVLPAFVDGQAFAIQAGDTALYAFKMIKNQVTWMQSYELATIETQWTDEQGNHLPLDTHPIDRKGTYATLAPGASGFVVRRKSGSYPLMIQIFSHKEDFD